MQPSNKSFRKEVKTPKSMNQAFCWMPDGKCVRPDNRNWAIKPQKVKASAPVKIVCDKNSAIREAYLKTVRKRQLIENRLRLSEIN